MNSRHDLTNLRYDRTSTLSTMASQHRPVTNVVVLGSTGHVGIPTVIALSNHPARFTVTAVTRDKSQASFPPNVRVVESDLSRRSLLSLFQDQDAVVSCLATSMVDQQKDIVDIAVECGIARLIPSEYGLDSTHPNAAKFVPITKTKIENLDYIRQFEHRLSWTTLVTGSFFDRQFGDPGWFGWNMAEHQATVFDGGDVEFETTNLSQIGAAIAAILSPEHLDDTANQVVFVNSFTTTQNKVVAALEKITGRKMTIEHETTAAVRECALVAHEEDPTDFGPVADLVTASVYGQGGLNLYSKSAGGLWNDRLGLEREDFIGSIEKALAVYTKPGA
ncbi:hypothetical protein LTR56_011348 [Elasticomyces elasticus]|nr:hypothetical protein LTR56_011348 [Elasticomyces elasticus]KAK3660950.1 hypothetical protein LTR22_007778 [Elasticomyces elasticus]KAK4932357.1 hypothetical protein LTR49_001226 [Elasticomyces elasticus]KAK5768365.1 hypothetical protein LTS12_001504 [Elasticomyces elasticus]